MSIPTNQTMLYYLRTINDELISGKNSVLRYLKKIGYIMITLNGDMVLTNVGKTFLILYSI